MADKFQYEYDVVFSFAGTQRVYVEKVNNSLKKYDISVFYDNDNSVDLWGKNLYRYLDCLYSKKARYCVMFISKEYGERPWTIHESQSAQERMFCCYDNTEFQEYILPVRFDDTQIPGIRSTTGYMDANKLSPDELAEKIAEKPHTFKQQNFRFGRDKRIGIPYVLRGCRKDSSQKLSGSKGKIFSAKSESHKELGFRRYSPGS